MELKLEELIAEGQVVGILLLPDDERFTVRELGLIKDAFSKGVEVGRHYEREIDPPSDPLKS